MAKSRLALILMTVLLTAGMSAGIALADGGGADIASAPELPIGSPIVGGANAASGVEYWRVTLAAGDRLVIDYGTTDSYYQIKVGILAPQVTDYTLGTAAEVVSDVTGENGKSEFAWIATGSGRWILEVYAPAGSGWLGYQLTARVQHFTSVTLKAPRSAAKGSVFAVHGSVAGVSAGKIALRLTSPHQKPISALVPVASTGAFNWMPKFPKKSGTWRLQSIYYGDATHRPSRASATIHVI